MMQKIKFQDCPLCEEELFSEFSHGCQMCGMSLQNEDEKFCSSKCKEKYKMSRGFKLK